VAIVGAGLAGAACAAGLLRRGWRVTVYDKSRGVGGRMATRRVAIEGEPELQFDHGAPFVAPRAPRFRALWAEAAAAGEATVWRPRIFADAPGRVDAALYVPLPGMPALVRRLLGAAPLRLAHTVTGLRRRADGWWVEAEGRRAEGPFDQVVVALPPPQAAALLGTAHAPWAKALAEIRMEPCWTLMAATDEVDWPWDAAEPARGPLAWVMRHDRRPGRSAPAGWATWVAHASASWSAAHLEEDPADVAQALGDALRGLLPPVPRGAAGPRWHHVAAHRWRYAAPAGAAPDGRPCWVNAERALGVCGDYLGGGGAEGAWHSGDALAERLATERAAAVEPASDARAPAVPDVVAITTTPPRPVDGVAESPTARPRRRRQAVPA